MANTTIETTLIAAEDFRPGYRYWEVRPGFEDAWTIASVMMTLSEVEVWRDGRFVAPELVTITRRDGKSVTFERGERVAIQGPWKAGA